MVQCWRRRWFDILGQRQLNHTQGVPSFRAGEFQWFNVHVSVMSFYIFHWKHLYKNPGDLLHKMVVSWDGYHYKWWFDGYLPSGKHTKSYWKWPIEIVDLPINSMVVSQLAMLNYQRVFIIPCHLCVPLIFTPGGNLWYDFLFFRV